MKNVIFILSCLFAIQANAQRPAIKFEYDKAGNQVKRFIQVVNLRLAQPTSTKDSSLVFNIYPNPTQDNLTIEGALENGATEAKVFLYDIKGSVVKQDTYNGIKKTISLVGYKSGIYFLEIKYSTKQSSNYRIVITE